MAYVHVPPGPSRAEKLRAATLDAVQTTMMSVAGDTETLLRVVAGGPQHWRMQCVHAFRGYAVDAAIVDSMFAFFCQQVFARFGQGASAGRVAAGILDSVDLSEPRPPSPREIADAWEVESMSSEEGRRFFYGADGHPEELIKRLRDVN